jgi:transcriptional regulator with PAS, ATPase and Fis domain
MPIYDMVKENQFRQDLLYRVNTIEVQLPPLRERKEDINLLSEHFLQTYAKKYNKQIFTISESAIKKMQKYSWPGNVRELQHAIERGVIMSSGHILNAEDLFFNPGNQDKSEESIVLEELTLEEVEKMLIRKALKKFDGNITLAAQELGLTRSSLYRRLEKYGFCLPADLRCKDCYADHHGDHYYPGTRRSYTVCGVYQ